MPVTDEMRAAYEEYSLARYRTSPEYSPDDDVRSCGRPYPDSLPLFQRLLVDRGGRIWAQEYARYWEPDWHPTYIVFSPDGLLLGRVDLPPRFQLFDAGSDWLLGVHTGDLDVPFVELYSVVSEPG